MGTVGNFLQYDLLDNKGKWARGFALWCVLGWWIVRVRGGSKFCLVSDFEFGNTESSSVIIPKIREWQRCLVVYDHFPGALTRDSQFQIKGTSGGLLQHTAHDCSWRVICLLRDTRCTWLWETVCRSAVVYWRRGISFWAGSVEIRSGFVVALQCRAGILHLINSVGLVLP
jgi:hypothetical protein